MRSIVASAVQLCATEDWPASLCRAVDAVSEAAQAGADLVVLPESYAGFGPIEQRLQWAFDPDAPERGATLAPLVDLSRTTNSWIIAGGTPEHAGGGRTYNTAVVLHRGAVKARYRKVHLFDAQLPDGSALCESDTTAPGSASQPGVVDCDGVKVGLSICFDLRFASHYARLRREGAEVMVVPSAFTRPTGEAHWEVLLRARAIETQSFVIAPAQYGQHSSTRASYGHSMVVDPWGSVLRELADGPGSVTARLEAARLHEVRATFGVDD